MPAISNSSRRPRYTYYIQLCRLKNFSATPLRASSSNRPRSMWSFLATTPGPSWQRSADGRGGDRRGRSRTCRRRPSSDLPLCLAGKGAGKKTTAMGREGRLGTGVCACAALPAERREKSESLIQKRGQNNSPANMTIARREGDAGVRSFFLGDFCASWPDVRRDCQSDWRRSLVTCMPPGQMPPPYQQRCLTHPATRACALPLSGGLERGSTFARANTSMPNDQIVPTTYTLCSRTVHSAIASILRSIPSA